MEHCPGSQAHARVFTKRDRPSKAALRSPSFPSQVPENAISCLPRLPPTPPLALQLHPQQRQPRRRRPPPGPPRPEPRLPILPHRSRLPAHHGPPRHGARPCTWRDPPSAGTSARAPWTGLPPSPHTSAQVPSNGRAARLAASAACHRPRTTCTACTVALWRIRRAHEASALYGHAPHPNATRRSRPAQRRPESRAQPRCNVRRWAGWALGATGAVRAPALGRLHELLG